MNLLDALANSLDETVAEAAKAASKAANEATKPAGAPSAVPKAKAAGDANKPVLQLNPFPTTLDTNTFKDSLSSENPRGDLRSLFAFRQLVDPIPSFSNAYSPTPSSTEDVYKLCLNGASIAQQSSFVAGLIATAKKKLHDETFADIDGTPGVWRPVYAVPHNWWDETADLFRPLTIDLKDLAGSGDGPFSVIGRGGESLQWRNGGGENGTLSENTKLHSVQIEYLMVGLRRPWLDPMLFETSDWFLSGQDAGFCSSGSLSGNNGVLPLIPTGILLGRNVRVSADWDTADAKIVDEAESSGQPAFLGPFMVSGSKSASSTVQVIGWVSDLVPYAPRMTKETPGSITVSNSGAFVARFSVEWKESGRLKSKNSGNFPVLTNKEIDIPAMAMNIEVKIDIMTFPKPFESWSTVATKKFTEPVLKKYELSGTTFSPKLSAK